MTIHPQAEYHEAYKALLTTNPEDFEDPERTILVLDRALRFCRASLQMYLLQDYQLMSALVETRVEYDRLPPFGCPQIYMQIRNTIGFIALKNNTQLSQQYSIFYKISTTKLFLNTYDFCQEANLIVKNCLRSFSNVLAKHIKESLPT